MSLICGLSSLSLISRGLSSFLRLLLRRPRSRLRRPLSFSFSRRRFRLRLELLLLLLRFLRLFRAPLLCAVAKKRSRLLMSKSPREDLCSTGAGGAASFRHSALTKTPLTYTFRAAMASKAFSAPSLVANLAQAGCLSGLSRSPMWQDSTLPKASSSIFSDHRAVFRLMPSTRWNVRPDMMACNSLKAETTAETAHSWQ